MKLKKYKIKNNNSEKEFVINIDSISCISFETKTTQSIVESCDGLDFHYEYNEIGILEISLSSGNILNFSSKIEIDNFKDVKFIYNDIVKELEEVE